MREDGGKRKGQSAEERVRWMLGKGKLAHADASSIAGDQRNPEQRDRGQSGMALS